MATGSAIPANPGPSDAKSISISKAAGLTSRANPVATSAADGSYAFTGLSSANYLVRLRPQGTDTLTYPYPQYGGLYFVALGANQTAGGKDFGLAGAAVVIPPTAHLTVGANVNTSKLAGSESTSQIAVNPTNANNLVIVSQSGDNNGALLPLSRSFDGGQTWTTTLVGAQDGLSTANPRPDAHVAFDSFGNLYLTYMVGGNAGEIRLAVLRSTDGGQSFTSLGFPISGTGFSPDSPWIATGPSTTNPGSQAVWISFTDYVSNRVMVFGGTAGGLGQFGGWSAPKTVNHSFGTFSTVAVGPAGQLVVSWQSTDSGGVVANSLEINYDASGTGNQFSADTLMASTNVGALDPIPAQPDRPIDAEARVAFDRSGGATRGRLYLVYTNEPITADHKHRHLPQVLRQPRRHLEQSPQGQRRQHRPQPIPARDRCGPVHGQCRPLLARRAEQRDQHRRRALRHRQPRPRTGRAAQRAGRHGPLVSIRRGPQHQRPGFR